MSRRQKLFNFIGSDPLARCISLPKVGSSLDNRASCFCGKGALGNVVFPMCTVNEAVVTVVLFSLLLII